MAKTKTEKLLNALSTGKEISASKIMNRFGLQNPGSTIHRLRTQGFTIFTNKKRVNGQVVYKYRSPEGFSY